MIDTARIAITVAIAGGPIIAVFYGAWVHWSLSRRIDRIERARSAVQGSDQLQRIWRSVTYTERQQAREEAVMASIGSDEPVQLYRREGRRFIAHGDAA